MTLSEFLKLKNMTAISFAENIECTPQAVSNYIKGERVPRPKIMQKILEITEGLVTANDFYPLTVQE